MNEALEKSRAYLASAEAIQSIRRDPYWPKWNTPWWHMCLWNELDLAQEIPKTTILAMVHALKNHYLPIFPIKKEQIPEGTDPYRQIACLCSVGSMYQVLFNARVDVDREIPWMREWFLRYQLPDGGLNCDESAYTKTTPKSSIVSTLSCLEAVLFCRHRDLTSDETEFLNRGANFLIRQKLYRKVSTGEVINPDWLEIRFPRFYDYDFFRGYYFLAKWSQHSGFQIPADLVDDVECLVSKQLTDEGIVLRRYNLIEKRTYGPAENDVWASGEASEIELMKAVSFDGALCRPLTKRWNEVRRKS